MQHYSAQMQYSKAIQSQSEQMTAKFRGVVMLKQFEVGLQITHAKSVCLSVCMSVCLSVCECI